MAGATPHAADRPTRRPQELRHLTQRAWARAGGVATPWTGHTARLFITAGTAESTDPLSSFRLGSALPFRSEIPIVLHGYYVGEVFARRFWLVNFSYRFPVWPGSERIKLQLAADYAQVDYLPGRELPRKGLRGAGTEVSVAVTKQVTVILGYGYGLDAPRGNGFGGHEANALIEVKF